MNIEKALEELKKYLGEYPTFKYYELFFSDLRNLLDNELKGKEKDFFIQLVTQFNNIKQFKKGIITVGKNEILAHISAEIPLYSIHISKGSKFNIRLLMFFEGDDPIFLCAFYEKGGKGRTGYKRFIAIALERYAKLKEGK